MNLSHCSLSPPDQEMQLILQNTLIYADAAQMQTGNQPEESELPALLGKEEDVFPRLDPALETERTALCD